MLSQDVGLKKCAVILMDEVVESVVSEREAESVAGREEMEQEEDEVWGEG